MTKNNLTALNNHLFAEIERLSDEELTGTALEEEINRSKAVTHVAQTIINNAALTLNAKKYIDEFVPEQGDVPEMLKIENKDV